MESHIPHTDPLIAHELRTINAKLAEIKVLAESTNGRVRRLEEWRAWMRGGLAAASVLVPTVTGVVVWVITQ